ncbi:LuxR C-terminal-related transcriptional regulator [Flavobacterium album]|uniref:LuxR C-terminal-related transcriptional regulator n=1 Tax=Flavobacterium album TaxID=2175091 RepID=UPI0015E8103F|nr:LuxR C-terminal-related transcriptional regulator [Flavobacterium album]
MTSVFSQEDSSGRIKILRDKISEIKKLATTNPEGAFSQIQDFYEEAEYAGYKEGELASLALKCWYYTNKDLKKAIAATQELQRKADAYDSTFYKAAVHEYYSNIYLGSDLPEKALKEAETALKMLQLVRTDDKFLIQDIIARKANVCTVAAEVYLLKKEYRKAVKVLLEANKQISDLDDTEKKRFIYKSNYTNLGAAYVEFDLDSAQYYINKSVALSNEGNSDIFQFNNSFLLGYIYKERKEYSKAIINYKMAEERLPYVNASLENTNLIYKGLADTYTSIDSLKQANIYLQKLQNSLLENEKNKNKSLHKIIDNELLMEKHNSIYIGIGFGLVLLLMSVYLVMLQRKNKELSRQEKVSEEYLKEHSDVTMVDEATLSRLIEMVKNDDQAFMAAFYNCFPLFLEKLRDIHPTIVPSETEFCALLKLNLSTKDIARYKNIEPKSVQNKKYRIRKKLNVPDDVDIYFWFNKF